MTQEDKDLLLKDLCARLPYGVIVFHPGYQEPQELDTIYNYEAWSGGGIQGQCDDITDNPHQLTKCKPYLRSMSSMTEEEYERYYQTLNKNDFCNPEYETYKSFDFLNSIHVDYRGLLPMGLALEAPEGMYKK